jgi:hypothetical protein
VLRGAELFEPAFQASLALVRGVVVVVHKESVPDGRLPRSSKRDISNDGRGNYHGSGWRVRGIHGITAAVVMAGPPLTHVRAKVARAWIDYIVDTKMPRATR